MKMKVKFNIAQKLVAGFGIILLAILINSVLTLSILSRSRSLTMDVTTIYSPSVEKLGDLGMTVTQTKMLIKNWVYIDRQANTPDKVKLAEIHETEFPTIKNDLRQLSEMWENKDEKNVLEGIFHKTDSLFAMHKKIMLALNSFEAYDDPMVLFEVEPMVVEGGEVMNLSDEIIGEVSKLEEKYLSDYESSLGSMHSIFSSFTWYMIIMSIILTAASAIIGYVLYSSIVKPLLKGVKFAQLFGNGDLTAQIEINQEDEIGILAKELGTMAKNLKGIVFSIKQNARDLVHSSRNLRDSSLQMSRGSADQAASAEEVSTSIEEMVANIDQNTDNAIQTEKITVDTAREVNIANELSSEAAKAMEDIAERISVISDIAFQTNILALNAAVEAARAGEHGRGFSVVAAEVRKLAEKSKSAADEIVNLVAKGLKVSKEAGDKTKMLVPEIEKTTQLIKEIAAASLEQKTGADQINQAMQQLNLITQENASSSDELTQSSEQLAGLARNLQKAVSIFNIGEDDTQVDDLESGTDDPAKRQRYSDNDKSSEDEPANSGSNEKLPLSKDLKGNKPDLSDLGKEFDLDNYEKF
ncbi:methyl-accepting chemotaxis protein [Thermophagus sp. OGC60D27]|uniref:methyl-accepting chemotaxis protein n=1 Tax=Thermophagus sp. OGC60D27 TaxID=3458415 RepID=UPI004037905B